MCVSFGAFFFFRFFGKMLAMIRPPEGIIGRFFPWRFVAPGIWILLGLVVHGVIWRLEGLVRDAFQLCDSSILLVMTILDSKCYH